MPELWGQPLDNAIKRIRIMKKEDVDLTDYMRILLGDMPPEFMIEVVIRVAFVYLMLVVTMRILGPRMEAMISRNEEIALVTLAASAGILIHNPDRGLLPSVVLVLVVVGIQYASLWKIKRSDRAEKNLLDQPETLVHNGRFRLKEMMKTRIQRERVVSEMRSRGLFNLADIQRVYIEANGKFTILVHEKKKERMGLCILPDTDDEFRERQSFSNTHIACKACGNVVEKNAIKNCPDCGADNWERAVITPE